MKPMEEADEFTKNWDFAITIDNKENPMDKMTVKGS
jgi:hypothetical protein